MLSTKLKNGMLRVAKNPIESILFVKCLVFIAYFAYYSTAASLTSNGIISEVFNSVEEHMLISIMLGAPSVITLYGLITKKYDLYHSGSLFMFVAGLFLVALRIITFGWVPFTGWALLLGPSLVCGIARLYLSLHAGKK